MFRRLKFELCAVIENIRVILLSAFLCALGGVLLWINGGSTWYFLRSVSNPHGTLSLSIIFTVWLITYGLVGVTLALTWLSVRCRLSSGKSCLCAFAIESAVYLLMLVWYALFFCTRLFLFPVVILLISAVFLTVAVIILRKTMVLIWVIWLLIECVQMYFIYFSFVFPIK